MKKIVLILVTMVLAASMLVAGGGQEEASGNPTMSISMHAYIHSIPNVYAQDAGLFEGYDVETSVYSGGPTQNEAISSNAWEVGTAGVGGGVLGAIGYNLKIIGYGGTDSNTIDLWARADSDLVKAGDSGNGIYGKAADWKDLDILCASGTPVQLVTIATLDSMGLGMSDVSLIDMSVAQSFPAFKAGEADVVALWSPFGIYAEREGWVKVSSARAVGVDLPIVAVATEKAINERPEMVQDWLNTYVKASEDLTADSVLAAEILYDFQKQEGIRVDEESATRDIADRGFADAAINKEYFTKRADGGTKMQDALIVYTDFMIQSGLISEADKQKILDNNFVVTTFVENLE